MKHKHQEFFTVEVSGALSFTDRAFFAPVEQEGAEVFKYSLHGDYDIEAKRQADLP